MRIYTNVGAGTVDKYTTAWLACEVGAWQHPRIYHTRTPVRWRHCEVSSHWDVNLELKTRNFSQQLGLYLVPPDVYVDWNLKFTGLTQNLGQL